MSRIIVITGTDTGVGKTVLTALLASHLRNAGANVAALKPISSGARDDARALRKAFGGELTLDEINPWHFRVAMSPLLAARKERRRIELREVVSYVTGMARRFQIILMEGAGGLLSPLGEGFNTRDMISALGAEVLVAGKNQLGVVNHVRLTLEALPPLTAARANVVLMSPKAENIASRSNAALLTEFVGPGRIFVLPHLRREKWLRLSAPKIRHTLASILQPLSTT